MNILSSATANELPSKLSTREVDSRVVENGDRRAIKLIPPSQALREQLRTLAIQAAAGLDPFTTLKRSSLEKLAHEILLETGQSVGFLGWTMVSLASAFWREQVQVVSPARRLLLLPNDLPHQPGCIREPSQNSGGDCAACQLERRRRQATEAGFQVLPLDDSAAIVRLVDGDNIDAIVGLASLDLLRTVLEPILWFGIPCMATPLLLDSTDEDPPVSAARWFDADRLDEMIQLPYLESETAAPNYLHLIRAARRMFEPDELALLAPPAHADHLGSGALQSDRPALDPVAGTEAIAYEFLCKGGKYSRPFITLAVHDAVTGGRGSRPGGYRHLARLPLAIKRAALSIEVFHKASLVHDDIEDDDLYRYGEPTLHRRFGTPVAINVGDYLIGLGYRLVSRESAAARSGNRLRRDGSARRIAHETLRRPGSRTAVAQTRATSG